MQLTTLFYILVILFSQYKTGSAGCSDECSGNLNRFNFQNGSSYAFDYQSSTAVQLVGNSGKAGSVSLEAIAIISVVDQCEYQLQLFNVKFNGPPTTQVGFDLAQELIKHPLRFAYDNGAVLQICPLPHENNDALNIKRGILSTFQFPNDFDDEDAYESDISGDCPVQILSSIEENDTTLVVGKKNLMACRNRVHDYSSLRFVPYNVVSKVQNVPNLDATQICIYKVQQEILIEATCVESHDLLAFRSSSGGGISARIESKLTFLHQDNALAAASFGEPESLLFNEKPFIYRESIEATEKARTLIKLLQDPVVKEVSPESAAHFQELVDTMKTITLKDLKLLAEEAKNVSESDPKAKRIYVDAISQCGTSTCIEVLVQLLNPIKNPNLNLELTLNERRLILFDLALTPHPTKQGVVALTAGLDQLSDQGLFAATSFVNTFIRQNKNGQNSSEVKLFVKTYLELLSKISSSVNPAENNRLIEALRAFGNLASFQDGIDERLAYLNSTTATIDVKLAAIQSLRRAPCVPAIENNLFSIYADEKTSVEIRLNAFLILVRQCASEKLIHKVVQHASQENKLNQIGSFVQTYFKSIRSSNDPNRDKNSFAWSFLNKIYPTDSDRYSTYSLYSSFDHQKNLGYHADLASIYVPDDSYPRQQYVNLTLDLWGSKVNLLELGYRIEHLHNVADNLFGPEGFLSFPGLSYIREKRKKENKHPKLAEYQAQFDAKHKTQNGLDFSAYVRLFGDEVVYSGAYDISVIQKIRNLLNTTTLWNAMKKEHGGSLYIHRLPYDSFTTIPIISGFPLRLASNGSIVINVDVSVKADVKDFLEGNAEIRLKLKPSAAYQGSLHMAVYSGSVKNGVRFTRNSQSATDIEFELKMSKNEVFSAKMSLPKPRQEVCSFETHVYTIMNDVPIEEQGVVANRGKSKMCVPSFFNQYTGLKICTSIDYPNASNIKESPYFPLTGPMKAEFFIDKDDPDLKSYELTASWPANEKGRTVNIKFDTTKSKINRQRSLIINYERQKSIDITSTSPTNKVTLKGMLESAGPNQTGVKVTANINEKIYEFVGKVKTETNRATDYRKYNFDGAVTSAATPNSGALKGVFEWQPGSKVNLNADLTELYDKPISLKARYEKFVHKHSIEYDFRGLEGPRRLAGDLNLKSLFDMDYKFELEYLPKGSQAANKITFEHKHSAAFSPLDSKLTANSKITSSLFPATIDYAFDGLYHKQALSYHFTGTINKNNKPYFKSEVAVPRSWSPDVNRQARFYITYDFDQFAQKSIKLDYKRERSGSAVDYNAMVDIDLPNTDYKFEFKRRSSETTANNLTIFRQDKPIIQLNVVSLQRQRQLAYFDVSFKTFTPYQIRNLVGRLSFETSAQVYKGGLYLADQEQNQKLSVQFDAYKITNGFDKKLNVTLNDMELEVKNKYTAQANNQGVDVSGTVSIKSQFAPQVYKWTYNRSPNKVQAQIETPIAQMNKASILAEISEQGTKKNLKYEVVIGKDTTTLNSVYDYSARNLLLDGNVKSTLAALKNIQYTVKSDQRQGLDAGFNLNVNDMHKLASFYKRATERNGDEKYEIGFTAKLGLAYNWDTSSNSSWNDKTGKYHTKNTLKTSLSPANKYRVDVELDTNNMHTKVDLENIPGIKTPVKGQAKKVGDNEYEISFEDASGPNRGLVGFKFTSAQQKIRLETAAFKSSLESQYTASKFGVGCSLTPDSAKPSKVFGLKYDTEAPNEFSRSAYLEVTYPERTILISSKRNDQPNAKIDQVIEWSPNHGKRQPVKLQYSFLKSSDSTTNYEFHLEDPLTLPDGFHLLLNHTKNGTLDDDNIYYSQNTEITLIYSNDPQRHLIIKKERAHKIVGRFAKYDKSVLVQHGTTNLNHKMYSTYFIERCEWKPECEYGLTTGFTYPTLDKRIEEFRIDILRSKNRFQAYTTAGASSWLSSDNDTNLYNFYVVTNRRPYRSISVSIVDKARKILLFQTTCALKGDDLATLMIQHAENGQQIKGFDATMKLETSNRLKIKYLLRPGLFDAVKASKLLPPILLKPGEIINWPVVQSRKSIGIEIVRKLKPLFESLSREETVIASELNFTSNLTSVLNEQFENVGEAINFAIDSIMQSLPILNQNVLMPLKHFGIIISDRFSDFFKTIHDVYAGSKLNDIAKGPGLLNTMSQIIKQHCLHFWHQIRPILVSNSRYEEMINFLDQIAAKVQWARGYQSSLEADQKTDDEKAWLLYPEFLNHKFSV